MTKHLDVLCIGAALVDIIAQIERHPLEDDEVFVSDLKLFSGGAAANTAYACAKLGLKAAFLGKLGLNDTFCKKIINDFNELSVDTSLIRYSAEKGTGSAFIALDSKGDRRIYAHSGAANELSKEDIILEEISRAKLIYLSSLKNLEPFIEAASITREKEIPVILNPGMLIIDQGFDNIKPLLEKIDLVILSKREFKTLFKIHESELSKDIIIDTSKALLKLGIISVIITMGEKGAFLINPKIAEIVPPIEVKKVVDTTGAGDAFSAGLIYGIIRGERQDLININKAIEFGNLIAGKCIQKLGARNGIPTNDIFER